MTLRENYKVENDGIWISRKELELRRDLYQRLAGETADFYTFGLYTGKQDVIIDLLNTIKNENDN